MKNSADFPIDTAQIVALYMQSILYGMGVITFVYGMRVMLWTREGYIKSRRDINWVMVVATIAMFIIATMEVGFGLQSNLNAFIYFHGPGGPKAEFAKISNVVTVMRTVDYALQTFIGDAIMIYRLYVVYGRNWQIVVLPSLLWLAEQACGWVVVYIEATLDSPSLLNNSRLEPFITSVLSMTLAMTTMTTGLIGYRIMQVNRQIASQNVTRMDGGSIRLTRVVRILIESGLIYTVSVVVFFSTFLAGNNAQYGVSDCVVQLIPISFTLITIRVHQGVATENAVQSTLAFSSGSSPVALKTLPSHVYTPRATTFSGHVGARPSDQSADDIEYRWKGTQTIV